jgi:hypothetical protein
VLAGRSFANATYQTGCLAGLRQQRGDLWVNVAMSRGESLNVPAETH